MVSYYLKKVWKTQTKTQISMIAAHRNISNAFKKLYNETPEKLKSYQNLKARTPEWGNQRSFRIASTVVRKAYSYNYMPSGIINIEYSSRDIGIYVENTITKFLSKYIENTGLFVHHTYQWLCATPDGFHSTMKIPIEIKYNKSRRMLRKIIAKNYHQLQFQMFCTYKNKILLIVYDGDIKTVIIKRDNHFINRCLFRLRNSIIKIMEIYDHKCKLPCKFVTDLIKLPAQAVQQASSIVKRNYDYKEVKLRYVFRGLSLEDENNLLVKLRYSTNAYERKAALNIQNHL